MDRSDTFQPLTVLLNYLKRALFSIKRIHKTNFSYATDNDPISNMEI